MFSPLVPIFPVPVGTGFRRSSMTDNGTACASPCLLLCCVRTLSYNLCCSVPDRRADVVSPQAHSRHLETDQETRMRETTPNLPHEMAIFGVGQRVGRKGALQAEKWFQRGLLMFRRMGPVFAFAYCALCCTEHRLAVHIPLQTELFRHLRERHPHSPPPPS